MVPWDSRWREIQGFPGYWISQYGQVFSMRRGVVLREWSNHWYGSYVTLRRDNRAFSRKVKSLWAAMWPDLAAELEVR